MLLIIEMHFGLVLILYLPAAVCHVRGEKVIVIAL